MRSTASPQMIESTIRGSAQCVVRIVGSVCALVVLAIAYASTLAPGITWANNGTDSGDLITAAATLGVAHPTGYPTYLLLARFFQLIPVGSLAFRTNLLSALFAAL